MFIRLLSVAGNTAVMAYVAFHDIGGQSYFINIWESMWCVCTTIVKIYMMYTPINDCVSENITCTYLQLRNSSKNVLMYLCEVLFV